MKRAFLLLLLVGLVVIELFLLESFLPYGWHHPMSELVNHIFPSEEYKPHPHMDWEIEMMLRQHPGLRIVLYVVTGALAVGNAFLMSKVWKASRSKPSSPQA